MKKSHKLLIGVGLVSLFSLGILVGKHGDADERKIYIPSAGIREKLVMEIGDAEENNLVENELPTSLQLSQIEKDHMIIQNKQNDAGTNYEKVFSLDGLQEVKNTKGISLLMFNNVIDYRPLGEMTNLEHIQLYLDTSNSDSAVNKPVDVSFVEKLKKLRIFDGGGLPVLDLTPFNTLDNIEKVFMSGTVEGGAPIAVSKKNKSTIVANPVTYSKQFDHAILKVGAYDLDGNEVPVTVSGDNFFVSGINEETNALTFEIEKTDPENNYISHTLRYTCPISWY